MSIDAILFASQETMILSENGANAFVAKAKLFNKWTHTRKTHIHFREFLNLFETYDTLAEIGRFLKVSRQVVSVYYEKYGVGDFFPGCLTGASWQKARALLRKEEESRRIPDGGIIKEFFLEARKNKIDVKRMWSCRLKDRRLLLRDLLVKKQNEEEFKHCYLQYWWKSPLRGYDKVNHYRSDITYSKIKDCNFLVLILKADDKEQNKYFIVPIDKLLEFFRGKRKVFLYLSSKENFGNWKQYEEAWYLI